jgi:uncharacterized RDD family membrane protein YckC
MAFQDDLLRIDTPENVAFGYPVAGIGSRFIAALVDSTLIVLLQAAVFLLTFLIAQQFFDLSTDSASLSRISGWVIAGLGLVSFLFLWGYYIFFEMLWNGQSPGKRWAGLRVIRLDGRPITLTESVIRNMIRLVDFLPSLYAVGVVVMFVDGRSRRLGDLAAGTLVVREGRSVTSLDALLRKEEPVGHWTFQEDGVGSLPLDRLSPAEIDLIESFFSRRNDFTNPDVISQQVLERIFKKMDLDTPRVNDSNNTSLLMQIHSALAHHHRRE